MTLREKVEETKISETLAETRIQAGVLPEWKLVTIRSWPVRLFGQPEFGKVTVSLTLAKLLLMDPSLSTSEKERISTAFVGYLSKADLQGLEAWLNAEFEKLSHAKSP